MGLFFPELKDYGYYAVIEPRNNNSYPWKYTIYQDSESGLFQKSSDIFSTLWGARFAAKRKLRALRKKARKVEELNASGKEIIR